jgi:hypothetical protein
VFDFGMSCFGFVFLSYGMDVEVFLCDFVFQSFYFFGDIFVSFQVADFGLAEVKKLQSVAVGLCSYFVIHDVK